MNAIGDLVRCVKDYDLDGDPPLKVRECASALYYLVNPYDETYDFFRGIGFSDDLAVVRKIHEQHFSDQNGEVDGRKAGTFLFRDHFSGKSNS